ncbi:ExbD/TolR family protein [Alteromonas flava]|uniref:ExbD/TolR family protein n=1 Tax=Alteromonas flava TaxID=2048003 RepID=UPI000C28E77C|nr:biopolymer transporter ExbD [Alteromonas flava]
MRKAKIIALSILFLLVSGCNQPPVDVITCTGAAKQGSVWVSISSDSQIKIGQAQFSKSLLSAKLELVKQSCDSVTVIIQADESAKHKVVYDTIQLIKSMGYQVSQ